MKTQIKKKFSSFLLFYCIFIIFIPNGKAEINCSLDVVYHFNSQQIEIVITNNEFGDINHTITGYSISNQNSGHIIPKGIFAPNPADVRSIIIDIIEPGESLTISYDFPANDGDVIEVIVAISLEILSREVTAGLREDLISGSIEDLIFIGSIISIITLIVVIPTCFAALYFRKIKPNRKIKKFQIRIDEIKSTINEMVYNDARTTLYNLKRELYDDKISSFNPVIDGLITQCNNNISFMERKQHFTNIFKRGEVKTAYQGLVELQKQYNSSDYHGLIDPAVFNQIVETLKEFSEKI